MDINNIIREEIQGLNERQQGIYTIPELVQNLRVYGLGDNEINIYQKILLAAYQDGGDEKVEEIYYELSGMDIEHISKGRYMFQRLADPDVVKQKLQNAKYVVRDAQYGVAPKKFAKE